MVDALSVAKAYAAVQKQAASPLEPKGAPHADAGPDFSELVTSAVTDAVKSSRFAETQMIGQAQGKVELVDAVTAISSAQASLQTVMAVRDQVISAYQQILAMPI